MEAYPIRPHHGLCLAFFRGKGYSEEFVENMTRMQKALEANAAVCLTEKTDGICAACPNNQDGVCATAEKVARYDREVLRHCGLSTGDTLPFRELEARVRETILLPGKREEICGDCQWSGLCR